MNSNEVGFFCFFKQIDNSISPRKGDNCISRLQSFNNGRLACSIDSGGNIQNR